MPQFKGVQLPLRSSSQSTITAGGEGPWKPLGLGKDTLFPELENLYWEGVRGDLENIIQTLKIWQNPEFSNVVVADEEDTFIHGFDTFIDQVTKGPREFAIRYGKLKEQRQGKNHDFAESAHYAAVLEEVFKDRQADHASSKLRSGVRRGVEALPRLQGPRQRTWALLQTAGFLDIEKLIEHRPPLHKLGFWKRPAIPQLALAEFDEFSIPKLELLHCFQDNCREVIRGSMFVSTTKGLPTIVCEACYRSRYYGNVSFMKAYKHSILGETITPPISRKICHCRDVSHFDDTGKALALFPVDKDAKHIDVGGSGTIQCSLLKLSEIVALAKYDGLQSIVGTKKTGKQQQALSTMLVSGEQPEGTNEGATSQKKSRWKLKQPTTKTESSLQDSATREAASSSTSVLTEPTADTDIPLFFRKYTTKYPFGNVHMALRVGPLVIENGVANTKGGALVTLRERPIFYDRSPVPTARSRSLAVGGSAAREVWQQSTPPSAVRKRYKAIMKQVVGVPFTGALAREAEVDIVDDLLAASRCPFDDPGLSVSDRQTLLAGVLDPVLEKLKKVIGSRVKLYLQSIVERLLDRATKLGWSATANNCQRFCNSLIDPNLFEPLVNGPRSAPEKPLYVMSFVCPDEGYLQRGVNTKYDVPSGLTEEYLLRFHFGRHDEADIIDANQEYWYDWGAFGGPLYKYQDLFPWDCTEAYGRYPTCCGDCNLAKHIWAFPFDAWSMVSLHLTRDRHMYAPAVVDTSITACGEGATPQSWMRNRLTVLAAATILARTAAAMAATPKFAQATAWLHDDGKSGSGPGPGLRQEYPALTRVKLGGIHRAQPFSHYFDSGTYSHYFLAEWALRPRREQIAAYEELRDGRVKLPDVVRGTWWSRTPAAAGGVDLGIGSNSDSPPNYGVGFLCGDSGLPCADVATGLGYSGPACAVSCGANCGSGCGSSSCGGGTDGGGGGCGGGE